MAHEKDHVLPGGRRHLKGASSVALGLATVMAISTAPALANPVPGDNGDGGSNPTPQAPEGNGGTENPTPTPPAPAPQPEPQAPVTPVEPSPAPPSGGYWTPPPPEYNSPKTEWQEPPQNNTEPVAPVRPETIHPPKRVKPIAPIVPPTERNKVRIGDWEGERPAWMSKKDLARTNNSAAIYEAQLATFYTSIGIPKDRATRVAGAQVAGALVGGTIGGIGLGAPAAVIGGAGGALVGAGIGATAGAMTTGGVMTLPWAGAGALIGGGAGAVIFGVPAAIIGGVAGGIIGGTIGGLVGAGKNVDPKARENGGPGYPKPLPAPGVAPNELNVGHTAPWMFPKLPIDPKKQYEWNISVDMDAKLKEMGIPSPQAKMITDVINKNTVRDKDLPKDAPYTITASVNTEKGSGVNIGLNLPGKVTGDQYQPRHAAPENGSGGSGSGNSDSGQNTSQSESTNDSGQSSQTGQVDTTITSKDVASEIHKRTGVNLHQQLDPLNLSVNLQGTERTSKSGKSKSKSKSH